jgi:polar amino acid transport system permease protein
MSVIGSLRHVYSRPWSGRVLDVAKFAALVVLLAWLLARGAERLGYNWQWFRVPKYLFTLEGGFTAGPLLEGLALTFKIVGVSLVLALVIGLTTALFRLSDSFAARAAARGYLELIRNTPLLIQIFFIYFVVSPVIGLSRFASAVAALSMFEGAYASEIFRAGIVGINKSQWEASYSLGLSKYQAYRHVILPQAVRRILPPLTGQGVALVKDSALCSTIAVFELTFQGQQIIADTFLTFEIWFTVAVVYLAVNLSLSSASQFMEAKLRLKE